MGRRIFFVAFRSVLGEGSGLGLCGVNGGGKSTLLRIIAGVEEVDSGSVYRVGGVRVSYVAQAAALDGTRSGRELASEVAERSSHSPVEADQLVHRSFAALRCKHIDQPVSSLSGGQQKVLQIALSLCEAPDLLLLDEPTNHLDIGAILHLERFLSRAPFSWIAVSHDRWFLENAVEKIAELHVRYPGGLFMCQGSYRDYLRERKEFLEAEDRRRASLENKVRNEQAWLRKGVKARTTKQKARIGRAYEMMDSLSLVRAHQRGDKVGISFTSSDRKTKKLVEFHKVSKSFGERSIFGSLELTLVAGQALGVLGLNGSGKSTFVNLVTGEILPDSGTIKRANDLTIAHFRQFEEDILESTTLKDFLTEKSDSVVYHGRSVHVATWAKRFKFQFEQLAQPFSALSGGEKARARISRIMLSTPDVLILDEPTNDLDIETLEMLEESLAEYQGALILVTHDRFMINCLCNSFLGLIGEGGAEIYADYEQWEQQVLSPRKSEEKQKKVQPEKKKAPTKKLTYKEQKEYDEIEQTISRVEEQVAILERELNEPDLKSDATPTTKCLQGTR